MEVVSETESKLEVFLKGVWGEQAGYVCIAARPPDSEAFQEVFFTYPEELPQILTYCESLANNHDVWYCPMVWAIKRRKKEHVKSCRVIWSDLDTCPPERLLLQPTFLVASSKGRWQGLWVVEEPVDVATLEQYSKRVAYYHADEGADKSGWDITQLLRVPYTYNFKYSEPAHVFVQTVGPKYQQLIDFDIYPKVDDEAQRKQYSFPEVVPDEAVVLEKYKHKIHPAAFVLLSREPKQDWSKALWQLETMLIESGLSREETFSIVVNSPCNKYDRDGRGSLVLWQEVCRAASHVASKGMAKPDDFTLGAMLSAPERELVEQTPNIVKDYIAMASEMTDASPAYHQAGAFILLSAILAGSLTVEADYGEIIPNLWFMILADTTLTRKTTSMDIAMDILEELDDDAVLATDGSIEGMVAALADRNNRCSLFLRDEFSGLMDMMAKKDHYAGMLETFAKLYDGKAQKKILRRQTIDIKKPIFLIYAGGIKSRILELLTSHHVDSGFLPRFILVSADADLGALRPLGPRRAVVMEKRDRIVARYKRVKDTYNTMQVVTIAGTQTAIPQRTQAELTTEAWAKFQFFEAMMNRDAAESVVPEYLVPTFVRLTMSGLKAAVLLAAVRCAEAGRPLEVDEIDILTAFYYVEQWRKTAYEITSNVGRTAFEVNIERVTNMLKQADGVMPKGNIMRRLKLTSRTAEDLMSTMEQRGLVIRSRTDKTEFITLLEGKWKAH